MNKAWYEQESARNDMKLKGEETLKYIEDHKIKGIVLAGRPYHIDGGINHGIPELITSYGLAVLTEDSISHLALPDRPIIVGSVDVPFRLYCAAEYVKSRPDLELIQLNSFGWAGCCDDRSGEGYPCGFRAPVYLPED